MYVCMYVAVPLGITGDWGVFDPNWPPAQPPHRSITPQISVTFEDKNTEQPLHQAAAIRSYLQ